MSRYKMLEECTKLVIIGGGRWWQWAMGQGEIEGSRERDRERKRGDVWPSVETVIMPHWPPSVSLSRVVLPVQPVDTGEKCVMRTGMLTWAGYNMERVRSRNNTGCRVEDTYVYGSEVGEKAKQDG
jgi:hypothetical protein